MAQFEVLALDKTNSRARAPGSGDSYLMPRSLAVGGETVTASAPVLDLSQSWNAGAVTFTGIKFNVASDVSAAGSLLVDLQVGGVSKFRVNKNGTINFSDTNTSFLVDAGGIRTTTRNVTAMWSRDDSIIIPATSTYAFGDALNAVPDTFIRRDLANTLAQRNGVNSQTSRLYGTYTDASNYRRLTKTMSAAGVAEIKPEGAGTGATGNVLYISGLPTSNPGPGILWNNGGVVNVGT